MSIYQNTLVEVIIITHSWHSKLGVEVQCTKKCYLLV